MLIFDSFPTKDQADQFIETVIGKYKLESRVYLTQEKSNEIDPFPGKLTPPIVLVVRTDYAIEEEICKLVTDFGGQFAGT